MYGCVTWGRQLVVLALCLPLFACADTRSTTPATTSSAQSPEERWVAFEAREIGVAFPYVLGDFKYERTTRFSEPGLGVALQYSSGEAFLSLYVFKGNARAVPDGVESGLVRQQFLDEQVVINARLLFEFGKLPGKYDIRGRPAHAMPLGQDSGDMTMLVKEFDLVPSQGQGRQFLSALWLTGYRGHFVKARVTYPVADPTQKSDRLEALRAALNRLLRDGRRQNVVERDPSALAM